MNHSIVYSSHTGNTKILAESIKEALPEQDCDYFGGPDVECLDTSLVFVGFWTDKGTCDGEMKAFLKTLKSKTIFLFGTAGFGGSKEYYDKILCSVEQNLDPSNKVMGTYMCQGKMPMAVRKRYENMMTGNDADLKFKDQIDNFDRASSHPDKADCDGIKEQVIKATSNL